MNVLVIVLSLPAEPRIGKHHRQLFRVRRSVTLRSIVSSPENTQPDTPLVGVIMGSQSDWETLSCAATVLEELGIAHEVQIVSAHRTPDRLFSYAESARDRGLEVIIAGAGGAAHLPGMVAAKTSIPVLGVPVQSKTLNGIDSLLSIAQMPAGVPVGTLAIGSAGATNAALLAGSILANSRPEILAALDARRAAATAAVAQHPERN